MFFENQIVKIYNFERKISALCLLDKLVKICGAASWIYNFLGGTDFFENAVLKVKEKYDSEMMKLKDLYAKKNEEKKKELLKAVENSTKTYEEIMAFICSEDEIN